MRSLIEHFRHPPWPALFGLSLVGYTISLTAAADIIPVAICGAGAGYLPGSGNLWAAASAMLALNSPLSLLTGWCIMLAAMMPTLLAAPIVHVRHSSLVRRRTRAVLGFCTGYALVWLAMAAPLGLLALLLDMAWSRAALPLAIAVAFVWNASPVHQRLLNRAMMLLIGIALLAERLRLPRQPRWHAPAIVALLRHLKWREPARVAVRNA